MKIGFLSPMALREFQEFFPNEELPEGYASEIFVPLIRDYLEKGYEVVLCTLNPKSVMSKVYRSKNLTIFAAGCFIKPKLRAATKFKYEIEEMVSFFQKNPCDVYHAHWTYEFAMAAIKLDVEKTLITIHDWPEYIYDVFHDYYRKCRLELSERVFEKGIHFTTVSPYIEEVFKKKYPDKELNLIPNYTKFDMEELELKKQLSVENPIIVSISTFDNRKNTKILMKSFKKIRKEIPKAKLRLIGRGHGVGEAGYKWAHNNDCSDGIDFIGAITHKEVINELKHSDLLIHPSLEESFGIVLIEAMFCKTPIIGGINSGAVPWILNGGNAGRLIDITDADSICRNAVDILSDSEVWNKYVEAGIERVKDFTLNHISDEYLKQYKKIVD